VENAARVAVPDGGDQLLEEPSRKIFAESTFRDSPEELAPFREFQDEVDFRLGRQHFVEFHDVRVVKTAHNGNLALHVGGHPRRG